MKTRRTQLESIFDASYIAKNIQGDVKVHVTPAEAADELVYNLTRATTQEAYRRALQNFLDLKRRHNEQMKELQVRLDTVNVPVNISIRPLLARAIKRVSDGANTDTLTWDTIQKAYAIFKNAAVLTMGFDPVNAAQGEIVDGEYVIEHNVGQRPNNCNDSATLEHTTQDKVDRHGNALPELLPIGAAKELMDEELSFNLFVMLWNMLLYFYWNSLVTFFSPLTKIWVVGKAIKKFVTILKRLRDAAQCRMNGGSRSECSAQANENNPFEADTAFEVGERAFMDIGFESDLALDLAEKAGIVSECLQSSLAIMTFVQSQAETQPTRTQTGVVLAEEAGVAPPTDWNAVMLALLADYKRDALQNKMNMILADEGPFGDSSEALNDELSVRDAIDELHADSQEYPVYRMRYYGRNKDRWTQLT